MANQENQGNLLNIQQNAAKTVEVGSFQIKGHLLEWEDVIIHISNISYITVADVPPTIPAFLAFVVLGALLFLLAGLLVFLAGIFMEDGDTVFAGLCVGALGGLGLWYVNRKSQGNQEKKRCLNIHMDSGSVFSIVFENGAFLKDVLTVFEDTFEKGQNNVTIQTTGNGDIIYATGNEVSGKSVLVRKD